MGVLTHLDKMKNNKALSKTKKALKHRFWTEIYQGAKMFYLSGMVNGKYLKNEIRNLSLFIQRTKFRPLVWRNSHPYVLVDRYEDLTPPALVQEDPAADRTVCLYGYVRGSHLKPDMRVHLIGAGDFNMREVGALQDPCPLPTTAGGETKKSLSAKDQLLYAPFSNAGNVLIDQDAVYIDIGQVNYTRAEALDPLSAEARAARAGGGGGWAGRGGAAGGRRRAARGFPSAAGGAEPGAAAAAGLLRGLQGLRAGGGLDGGLEAAAGLRLFRGGRAYAQAPPPPGGQGREGGREGRKEGRKEEGTRERGKEEGTGKEGRKEGRKEEGTGEIGKEGRYGGGGGSEEEGEAEGGGRGASGQQPREKKEVMANGRVRRKAVFADNGQEDEESDSKDESEEEGSEVEEDVENSDEEDQEGNAKWKQNLAEKAAEAFLDRQNKNVNWASLVYAGMEGGGGGGRREEGSVGCNHRYGACWVMDVTFALGTLQGGGAAFRKLKSASGHTGAAEGEEKNDGGDESGSLGEDVDGTPRGWISLKGISFDDWEEEGDDCPIERLRDKFVTGNWAAGGSEDEGGEEEGGDGSDGDADNPLNDDEVYGDFEDLETGEKFEAKGKSEEEEDEEEEGGEEEGEGEGEGTADARLRELNALRKAAAQAKKKADRLQQGGLEKQVGMEPKGAAAQTRKGFSCSILKCWRALADQAARNRAEFAAEGEAQRLRLEGFRQGLYVRIKLKDPHESLSKPSTPRRAR
ncbi:unnamed protein product [Heterosigma akashiwo]